jgi:hypothetical protein
MTVISGRRRKQKKGERSKLGNGEWESKFLVPIPHSLLTSFAFIGSIASPYSCLSGRAVQPRSGLD